MKDKDQEIHESISSKKNKIRDGSPLEQIEFFHSIVQNCAVAIFAINTEHHVIYWNKACEELTGYSAHDMIGTTHQWMPFYDHARPTLSDILIAGKKEKLSDYYEAYGPSVLLPNGLTAEGWYPGLGGRERYIIFDAAPVFNNRGELVAAVETLQDITPRKEMEQKLIKTQEQLLQSEKLAAMGRLTSQIAHELNNPISGIIISLELLKTDIPPGSERMEILNMALSESVRVGELLRKMLSFSKPDRVVRQVTDINSILEEILALYEKPLREGDIHIFFSFAEDMGKVLASRDQLWEVFLNLIYNARDAMPKGGTLTIKTRAEGDNVHIEISDTGIGIKQENLNKIFDAFFTTKDAVKDVGMGMSVCYGLIKDHGGDIKVESEWGSGTTFTVILPVSRDTDEPFANPPIPEEED
jgi:two-component system NtrC family sensor kinase